MNFKGEQRTGHARSLQRQAALPLKVRGWHHASICQFDTEDSTTPSEEVKSQYVYPATYPLAALDLMGKYLEPRHRSLSPASTDDGSRDLEAPDQDMRVKKPSPLVPELSKKALEKVKEQTKTCTTVPNNRISRVPTRF